ncbi:peroxisomal membrane 22 kda family protein [Citrus sinensis]|uniref:Uncharacterized protein n=2 Tax=Citrus sinensis TaxID=2711 RepID=A0A067H1V4_CITSI|nr:peroxisomal membrane 22 kda family protein [Citrus sinensis]KDO81550.1 hypothetical protein CISIN_1g024491mg [Citrus sinensis]KDO81551.1 hypothetical protein CISIN_1g024491mg [Citrus sinensis]
MGSKCKSVKTLSYSFLLRLSEQQQSLHGVSSFIQPLLTNQQWRRFYCSRPLSKIRDPKIFRSFNLSSRYRSHSHSFSSFSSNSSSSKFGFVGWYLGKLESHPLTTKGISSSLIYVAADLTSQMITLPPSGSIDSIRTLRMAVYGMLILGPSQHYWFNFLSRILPKRDALTTLKKIFMGQAIYGPLTTTIFFSYNAALQGETTGEIVARLKRDLLPTMGRNLVYWPICDFITFKFIPVHLQPLVNSSFAYVWTIYLTYKASLSKVSSS